MKPTALIIGIRPWLIGVLVSTGAMFLCWGWGDETASLLGGEPGIWARVGKGSVIGVVIAGLQWPIVRAAGVRPLRFIAFSGIGFAAGYPLGQTVQGIMILDWRLQWMHWMGYGSALATFGLSLSMPQWWLFRRHMLRASLWIVFSVAAWMLTGTAWIVFGNRSVEAAIVYGIVTGVGLVWLVRFQPPNATRHDLKGADPALACRPCRHSQAEGSNHGGA
jgi:hypothetical protein